MRPLVINFINVKGVRINRKEPPKLGSAWAQHLAVGASMTPCNKPLPTWVILPNLVVLGQMVYERY